MSATLASSNLIAIISRYLYDNELTPGQYVFSLLEKGKKHTPDFYRSDLQQEFDRIWDYQAQFYPEVLTFELKERLVGKNASQTWDTLAQYFVWTEQRKVWNEALAQNEVKNVVFQLTKPNRKVKGVELKKENYEWRHKALSEKMHPEELAIVFQEINADINKSSGYLGAISDRSKNLFFNNITVGQYSMNRLNENRHNSLKNLVFYRQDYMDEFEAIWESQARFHPQLTPELKAEIRDVVIFFQRRLKSQKSLISICEFERKDQEVVLHDGKKKTIVVGSRVIPRSSPLFQDFKIWQSLNNLEVIVVDDSGKKKRAKKNVASYGLEEEIELRLSDGLCKLAKGEADTIIIAGMGGLLVQGILENGREILEWEEKRPTLILQPQSDLHEVRIFLQTHAYHIVQEKMLVDEGKYYTVIKAEPGLGELEYTGEELQYGRYNLEQKDAVLYAYLKQEKSVLQDILKKLEEVTDCAKKTGNVIPDKTVKRLDSIKKEIELNSKALEYYI